MNNLPETVTLQGITELISKVIEADTSFREDSEVLIESISKVCDNYELTDQDMNYITYSFLGLEEQANSKTLLNASKAQKIINKKGK